MPLSNLRVVRPLVLLGAFLIGLALPAWAEKPAEGAARQFGKTVLAETNIPLETVAEFNAFKPSKAKTGESTLVNAMLADGKEWFGPPIEAKEGHGPYSVVITITGTALEDGDVVSMWKAGWRGEDGITHSQLVPGLTKLALKAGESFTLSAAPPPNRFRVDGRYAPAVEFNGGRNLNLTSVQVAVYSGVGSSGWVATFLRLTPLWIGLVMMFVWWFWFWRK